MDKNFVAAIEVTMRRMAILGAALAAVLFAGPAVAQSRDLSVLADKLDQIERDLRDLQAEVYGGQPSHDALGVPVAPGGDASPHSSVRINAIERELSQLTGQVEELSFEVRRAVQQMETVSRDMELRLRTLETGAAPAGGSPVGGSGPTPLQDSASLGSDPASGVLGQLPASRLADTGVAPPDVKEDPDAYFNYARTALLQGDVQTAEAAFGEFVSVHPRHEKAGEAQHWLGEIYLQRGANAQAAGAFMESVQKHPRGARAPESWLKLGVALNAIGEKAEACKTLEALPSRFPDASQSLLRQAEAERARASCNGA